MGDDHDPDHRKRRHPPRFPQTRGPEQVPQNQEHDRGEEDRTHRAREPPLHVLAGREDLELAEAVLADLVPRSHDRLPARDLVVDGVDIASGRDPGALGGGEVEREGRLHEVGADSCELAALGLAQVGDARELHEQEVARLVEGQHAREVAPDLNQAADGLLPRDGASRGEQSVLVRHDVAREHVGDHVGQHPLELDRERVFDQDVELVIGEGHL